jgi:hypothetical protein
VLDARIGTITSEPFSTYEDSDFDVRSRTTSHCCVVVGVALIACGKIAIVNSLVLVSPQGVPLRDPQSGRRNRHFLYGHFSESKEEPVQKMR